MKGGIMKKRRFAGWILFPLVILFLLSFSTAEGKKKVELVGQEILNFTLPSTHDRLINYADEYYGKHHLIITFFPAAYTPI